MHLFYNLDLLTVGIAIAAIGILGFIVYFNNPKSITNQTFLAFSLVAVAWSFVNYSNYQVSEPLLIIFFLRLVIYFAVWYCFFLFQLFYVFPESTVHFPKFYRHWLFPFVFCSSLLTVTPLVFKRVSQLASPGQVSTVEVGFGIAIFGITVVSLLVAGFVILYKKFRRAKDEQRSQLKYILAGAIITFTLHIIFNFILPAFFNITRFIPLGALFTFPLIALTTYAILKHHFLNLKIIATEILTFSLTIAILLDVVISEDPLSRLFRFFIFLLVLGVGISLIKSVRREVKQREQLEILTKKLEEANDQLKVLDKARAEFITIASHQLRQAPATIKWGLSSALQGDYGKVEGELKTALEKTTRANDSQISLIDNMLNASRIERGKMEFMFQPSNLLELAKLTIEQLEPIAKEKGLTLTFKALKNQPPEMMADKEKVRQVMNNFIDNSLKYTKAGSVNVELSWTNDEIKFAVSDTGKGMTPEEKATSFEKYKRGKDSIKQSAGLGLGLYVAKIIIEQHKGKIWAESPGVGKGSTFMFTLPVKNGLSETAILDLTKSQG